MKIADRLRQGGAPCFSFEFFPPKSDEGVAQLFTTLRELQDLAPAFVSVTYGAGGSTRQLTVDLVSAIKRETGIEAMAHLTCVGHSRSELSEILQRLRAAGVDNVLALRGDPPRGATDWRPPAGGLASAAELAALARETTDLCVVGACYPEHAELDYVRAKVDAGVSVLITQLFFDNADYVRFVERLRAARIDVPVLPGIVPVTSAGQLERVTALTGAGVPARLRREVEARAHDPQAVAQLGLAYATAQCAELLDAGAPGLHLYTFNRSPAALSIVSALRAQGRLHTPVAG
jgi:methylenetetrahydrofolate reductase (NADPH)